MFNNYFMTLTLVAYIACTRNNECRVIFANSETVAGQKMCHDYGVAQHAVTVKRAPYLDAYLETDVPAGILLNYGFNLNCTGCYTSLNKTMQYVIDDHGDVFCNADCITKHAEIKQRFGL